MNFFKARYFVHDFSAKEENAMKRFVSLLVSAVLLMLLLTGCAENTSLSPSDPVTVTLWHVYGEQADSPMNRLVEEFNSSVGLEKGIVVSVTNVTGSSKISGQLEAAIAGTPGALEIPDLFSRHTNTAVVIGADKLVDWNDFFSKEELSDFVPEFIEDGTKDEKFVVFPVSKSTYALFINGSQFERFSSDTGVNYDMLSTWEGFFDAAQKYYEWSGGKTFCALDYLIRHVELDVLAKGDELEYTQNGWYDLESESVKESFMMFANAIAKGYIAVSDLYANTQVMTGEALSGIGSTAAIGYYNDEVTYPDNTKESTDLQVLPLPRSGEGTQYMPQTGVGLAAYYKNERKAEAAAEFIKWFTQGERNLDFVVSTGYMPVNNAAFDAIENYDFASQGYLNLYSAIKQMRKEYIPVVRPDFDGYYDKVDELYNGIRAMQAELSQRSDSGEDVSVLANEIWELFSSIR